MNPNVGLGQRSELPSCFVCRYSPCSYTSQTYEIRLQGTDWNYADLQTPSSLPFYPDKGYIAS